jgi:flavin reductase (DIM6/NTAB) family NADH-FMN oxidoreductase RutF
MRPGRQSDLRAGLVNPKAYKNAVGRFATGVTVVTTHLDDDHFAITISSFTSVSLDPVQVLVCVEKTTRFHPAVLAAGRWAVSVLAVGQEDVSRWFATRGRSADPDQFAGFAHHAGALTGAVLFDEALTQLECRTVAAYDGGDHAIILGEVIGVDTSVDAGAESREPLVYFEGGYRRLGGPSTPRPEF